MKLQHFFDPETFTLTYVVFDERTKDAVVIDSVLDFDPASGKVSENSVREVISFLRRENLRLHYILETHAHADHLSASQILKDEFPKAKISISHRITSVQRIFSSVFNLKNEAAANDKDFDYLFHDNEVLPAGTLSIKAIPTPGHTPACTSFLIEDMLFTGDALFMPDYGSGRCDFPEGSARSLYQSIKSLYELPDSTRVLVGHDYLPDRELQFETTIGESKKSNIHLRTTTTVEEYVTFREARDKTLKAPRLLLPSLQVNIRAGKLPVEEDNGRSYLKLPLSR